MPLLVQKTPPPPRKRNPFLPSSPQAESAPAILALPPGRAPLPSPHPNPPDQAIRKRARS